MYIFADVAVGFVRSRHISRQAHDAKSSEEKRLKIFVALVMCDGRFQSRNTYIIFKHSKIVLVDENMVGHTIVAIATIATAN